MDRESADPNGGSGYYRSIYLLCNVCADSADRRASLYRKKPSLTHPDIFFNKKNNFKLCAAGMKTSGIFLRYFFKNTLKNKKI